MVAGTFDPDQADFCLSGGLDCGRGFRSVSRDDPSAEQSVIPKEQAISGEQSMLCE